MCGDKEMHSVLINQCCDFTCLPVAALEHSLRPESCPESWNARYTPNLGNDQRRFSIVAGELVVSVRSPTSCGMWCGGQTYLDGPNCVCAVNVRAHIKVWHDERALQQWFELCVAAKVCTPDGTCTVVGDPIQAIGA